MLKKTKKLVSLDPALLKCIEDEVHSIGQGCNVSGWISDACDKKLFINGGIGYRNKIRRLRNEMDQSN